MEIIEQDVNSPICLHEKIEYVIHGVRISSTRMFVLNSVEVNRLILLGYIMYCQFLRRIAMPSQSVSDEKATRPFCYVADAVLAFLLILTEGRDGENYNMTNNCSTFLLMSWLYYIDCIAYE